MVSPRFENILKKYEEMYDKKIEKNLEYKKSLKYTAKIYTDSILKCDNKNILQNKILHQKNNSIHCNFQNKLDSNRESKMISNNKSLLTQGKNSVTATHSRKTSQDKQPYLIENKQDASINLKPTNKGLGSVVGMMNNISISNISNGFKHSNKQKPNENEKKANILQNNYFKKEQSSIMKGNSSKNTSMVTDKSQLQKVDENSLINNERGNLQINLHKQAYSRLSGNVSKNLSKSNSKQLDIEPVKQFGSDKLNNGHNKFGSVVISNNNQLNMRISEKKHSSVNTSPKMKYFNKQLNFDYSNEMLNNNDLKPTYIKNDVIVQSVNNIKPKSNNEVKEQKENFKKEDSNKDANSKTTSKGEKLVNLNLNLKAILEKNEKNVKDKVELTENYLETSNCSVKSTARESNYFKKEAEKLSNYIKKCTFIFI